MEFSEVLNLIVSSCPFLSGNEYDGIIIKKLAATNTISDTGASHQSHMAFTGRQKDFFPFLNADGYFNVGYETKDDDLKKYFILQIPLTIYKANTDALTNKLFNLIDYTSGKKVVKASVLRSRRNNADDQIELSIKSLDDKDFIEFRKLLRVDDFFVLLKKKNCLEYDLVGIRTTDKNAEILSKCTDFYKLPTQTPVDIMSFVTKSEGVKGRPLLFKLSPEKSFSLKQFDKGIDRYISSYIFSLLAKPFVILSGNSGTGKTRIALRFAKYLEKQTDTGINNTLLIPVGADWTDNTKILGYFNPLANEGKGEYVKSEILTFLELANENPSIPFFLILDEMNLSHVERYFSDFLSAMESGEQILLYKKPENCECAVPEKITLPENLFVTGTVNIDETTYMFSPKVLDRANVIEFKPEMDDILENLVSDSSSDKEETAEPGVAEGFMGLANKIRRGIVPDELKTELEKAKPLLESVYKTLEKSGFEFAYRTAKEIRLYAIASFETCEDKSQFNINPVIDQQIVQKILPKIHGNKKQIGSMLVELKTELEKNNDFELSQEKVSSMIDKLEKYQYASFI